MKQNPRVSGTATSGQDRTEDRTRARAPLDRGMDQCITTSQAKTRDILRARARHTATDRRPATKTTDDAPWCDARWQRAVEHSVGREEHGAPERGGRHVDRCAAERHEPQLAAVRGCPALVQVAAPRRAVDRRQRDTMRDVRAPVSGARITSSDQTRRTRQPRHVNHEGTRSTARAGHA